MDIPLIAGMVSTVVFAVSNLPMLRKALRTRDVSSYSLSSMVMINVANVVHSLYVFSLPVGPIWALHTFYLASCAIMLVLCLGRRAVARSGRSSCRRVPMSARRATAPRSALAPGRHRAGAPA